MHIKDIKNKLRVLKKRAQGSVGTAIKVLTSVVLGASILVGGYALTNEVVLPNTTEKVESMFAYSADAEGNVGGSGTVEPTPEGPQIGDVRTFTFIGQDADEYFSPINREFQFTYEYGMTWADWLESDYNTEISSIHGHTYKMYGAYDFHIVHDYGGSETEDGTIVQGIYPYEKLKYIDGEGSTIVLETDLIDEAKIYFAVINDMGIYDGVPTYPVEPSEPIYGEEKSLTVNFTVKTVAEQTPGYGDMVEATVEEFSKNLAYKDGMTWEDWTFFCSTENSISCDNFTDGEFGYNNSEGSLMKFYVQNARVCDLIANDSEVVASDPMDNSKTYGVIVLLYV